jgi:hypothetical protein
MQREIKYIGFYNLLENKENRASNLAAINKMNYICDALKRSGHSVHIISPSWLTNTAKKTIWCRESTVRNKNKKVTFCPGFLSGNKIFKFLSKITALIWLTIYLLKCVKKGEKILVYHSPLLSVPIRIVKRLKKVYLILEVEEIYSEVWKKSKSFIRQEKKLINEANEYIVVSEVLLERLKKKPALVLYGSYHSINKESNKGTENKLNIVYAGSIDMTKKAAENAIKSMEFLDDKYVLNILGYGTDNDVNRLKKNIDEINKKLNRKACIYHGVKKGEEFSNFLLKCQVGINPQENGEYMSTAFPSKILTYLTHNLYVVSSPISTIVKSEISSEVSFSIDDNPVSISNAIKSLNINNGDSIRRKEIISRLDEKFVEDLSKVFSVE